MPLLLSPISGEVLSHPHLTSTHWVASEASTAFLRIPFYVFSQISHIAVVGTITFEASHTVKPYPSHYPANGEHL